MPTPTWTSVEDVTLYTGITVTDEIIVRAEADIAMFCMINLDTYDADLISDNDAWFLKMAATQQSAWLLNQVATYEVDDVTSMNQDGANNAIQPTALMLAPRARTWLNNLSWVRPRKTRVGASSSSGPRYSLTTTYGNGWYPIARRF